MKLLPSLLVFSLAVGSASAAEITYYQEWTSGPRLSAVNFPFIIQAFDVSRPEIEDNAALTGAVVTFDDSWTWVATFVNLSAADPASFSGVSTSRFDYDAPGGHGVISSPFATGEIAPKSQTAIQFQGSFSATFEIPLSLPMINASVSAQTPGAYFDDLYISAKRSVTYTYNVPDEGGTLLLLLAGLISCRYAKSRRLGFRR